MKERTMNGMPIQEVWKKLRAEFPPEDVKCHPSTHMEYVSVEKIEERLNAVVGMENWNFFPTRRSYANSGYRTMKAVSSAAGWSCMMMTGFRLCAVHAVHRM